MTQTQKINFKYSVKLVLHLLNAEKNRKDECA